MPRFSETWVFLLLPLQIPFPSAVLPFFGNQKKRWVSEITFYSRLLLINCNFPSTNITSEEFDKMLFHHLSIQYKKLEQ